MNEKLNIQDLVDMLAEKHGMNKKNADSFVKEFFQLIEESLEKDKYVKIRGLGTFKLIDVDSRESVNVNTGERFEIQGHTKVSFTPESTLKDVINRPFSHFETVVLNDDTVLEDTPLENDNEEDEDVESKVLETEVKENAQPTGDVSEITEKVIEEEVMPTEIVEPLVTASEELVIAEEAKNAVQESVISEVIVEEDVIPENTVIPEPELPKPVAKDTVDSSTMKYFIGIVVFVVLLCGGAVAFMYYPDLLDKLMVNPSVEKIADSDIDKLGDGGNAALADSIVAKNTDEEPARTDTVAEVVAVKTPTSISKVEPKENVSQPVVSSSEKKAVETSFEPDSVGYTIAGTETTYTIKEGETLTKVALRFYGTKALWPYIVKYNPDVIKNPDHVPYGTTIKIPKLVKKQ